MRGALRKSLAPSPLAAMATGPAQRTCVLRTKERIGRAVLQSMCPRACQEPGKHRARSVTTLRR